MIAGKYSLNNLRDIVVPNAPPFWPPAPEVWLLFVIIVAALLILIYQWHRMRRRNAYRRAGSMLLGSAKTVHDVSVILKRAALAAFPREQVASLVGEDWIAFLRHTDAGGDFPLIAQASPDEPASPELIERAGVWIRRHRVPGHGRAAARN